MAERRGPEGEPTPEYDPASENGPASGNDAVSGEDAVQGGAASGAGTREDGTAAGDQDDGSHGAGDRARDMADERTELTDDHRESGDDSERTGDARGTDSEEDVDAAETEARGTEVLPFPSKGEAPAEEAGAAEEDASTEELVDFDELGDEPVDLAELRADDALLNALGGTDPEFPSRSRGQGPDLQSLLVAWRQDVDAAPIGDLVDTDTAVTTIAEAQRRPWRRLKRRHLVPVASAAAVLMITFTGVGLAARDALPGDMLWGVAQVLYNDHTRTVTAASSARQDFHYAERAWAGNEDKAARDALQRGKKQLKEVDREHGLEDLKSTQQSLANRFDRGHYQPPSSTSATTSVSEELPPSSTSQPSPSEPPSLPPSMLPPPPTETRPSGPPSTSHEPSAPTSTPSETSGDKWPSPTNGSTMRNSESSGLFAPRSR